MSWYHPQVKQNGNSEKTQKECLQTRCWHCTFFSSLPFMCCSLFKMHQLVYTSKTRSANCDNVLFLSKKKKEKQACKQSVNFLKSQRICNKCTCQWCVHACPTTVQILLAANCFWNNSEEILRITLYYPTLCGSQFDDVNGCASMRPCMCSGIKPAGIPKCCCRR